MDALGREHPGTHHLDQRHQRRRRRADPIGERRDIVYRVEIALLGSPVPAPEQEPPASDILMILRRSTGNEMGNSGLPFISQATAKRQCCTGMVISSPDGVGIMFALRLAMIQSEPAITSATMSTPKASARTLLVLSGPVVMWRKNTR
jgi:hypothetical protein